MPEHTWHDQAINRMEELLAHSGWKVISRSRGPTPGPDLLLEREGKRALVEVEIHPAHNQQAAAMVAKRAEAHGADILFFVGEASVCNIVRSFLKNLEVRLVTLRELVSGNHERGWA